MSLLRLNSISKSYAGVPALNSVSLTIEPGEIHALMGENGAGKSTLIKILAGVVTPDRAEIHMEGEPVVIDSPANAHRLGLRFIHQELNVVPALSVAENIFLGRDYPTHGHILIDWKKLYLRAQTTLATLGITHINPRQKMAQLSIGDQMLVRISSAFLGEADSTARIYVMDEPTAALTKEESDRLFKVLRKLRKSGRSVIYVSHRLDEVMALCDRATVLRDGAKVDTGNIAEITSDDLVSLMIGRRVEEAYPRAQATPQEEIALEIEGMAIDGVKAVSLAVCKGEIVGIAGLAGAGQTNLLRSIFGAQSAKATRMLTNILQKRPQSPVTAWKAGLAYVPRERRLEGLVLSRSIVENITLPHLQKQSLGGAFLDPRGEAVFAKHQSERVRLKSAGLDQLCFRLSGGNQQKVVFAKALAGNPDVLLLDEPTRGVDVGAKFDIYSLIREMTKNGMAVLLASSDLPELIGMCDRIVVMRDGDIIDVLETKDLTEELLINACYDRSSAPALHGTPAHKERTDDKW